jgi:hypothetical protein
MQDTPADKAVEGALPHALPALRAAAVARAALQGDTAVLRALEDADYVAAMDELLAGIAEHAADACHGGALQCRAILLPAPAQPLARAPLWHVPCALLPRALPSVRGRSLWAARALCAQRWRRSTCVTSGFRRW